MWGYLLGGVRLFAALFLELVPVEWLHGLLRGGPVPVDIPSLPLGNRMMKQQQYLKQYRSPPLPSFPPQTFRARHHSLMTNGAKG
jgi:hypothetical protein